MAIKSNETQISNWNAGNEYNQLIKTLKEGYINASLIKDYESALDILSIDLDFSEPKIIDEVDKKIKTDELKQQIKNKLMRIKLNILETNDFLARKKNYPNYEIEARKMIGQIRREIWTLQGKFGVLYPYEYDKRIDINKSLMFNR